jgi:hypothetical protein
MKQVTIGGVLCGSSQESDNQEPEHDRHGSQESENQKSQHPGVASRECGTAISHGSANNDPLLRKSLKPSKEDFQQVAAYARSGHHGKRGFGLLTRADLPLAAGSKGSHMARQIGANVEPRAFQNIAKPSMCV